MSPHSFVNYSPNQRLSNSVLCGKLILICFSGCISSSNGKNFLVRKLCANVFFAFVMTIFGYFVGHVVCLGPEKQMSWVDAGRIVTFMKYEKSTWNWANEKFVRDMAGSQHLFTARDAAAYNSITLSRATCPQYAPGFLFPANVTKESINQWCYFSAVIARLRAISSFTSAVATPMNHESSFAKFAHAFNFARLSIRHDGLLTGRCVQGGLGANNSQSARYYRITT